VVISLVQFEQTEAGFLVVFHADSMLRSDHGDRNPGRETAVTTDVLMPQMGLEVNEATVLDVLVGVGDEVAAGTPLLELETDKATTEVVATRPGFVTEIDVVVGQVVAVGERLAVVGDTADERAEDDTAGASYTGAESGPTPPVAVETVPNDDAPVATTDRRGRLRAAPVARRAAARLGVQLETIAGTGPRGRITLPDVEAAANGAASARRPRAAADAAPVAAQPEDVEPFSGLRRTIARRMTASQLIPQYQLQRDVDATHLLAQKEAQAAAADGGPRPGFNDLLMQAIAEMVVRHPALATSYVDDPQPGAQRRADVDVGLAVATDRGLVVPVLRRVDRSGLRELAGERGPLVAAAREGRLAADQMAGGVITLSNLAAFGVDRFTAMLNPGESAIVAVGRVTDRVAPRGRGLTVVPILTVTISFDHRTVDGAVGGAALAELAELLEGGMTWRP
jgi:pyruvate dehydrogenase E2 component (dihydrolipoamide acetyltransferase)